MIRLSALDATKALINDLEYINLQWTRRYYTFGEFSVLVPLAHYDPLMRYAYSPDRPELGIIQQVQIHQSTRGDFAQLSGFFLEKQLDDKIIYPVINYYGNIEVGARQLFATYKEDIPATLGTVKGLGMTVQFQETGAELGTRLYELLATQELSHHISYDYVSNTLTWGVWQGIDRTDSQSTNNRVAFSRALGNVKELQSVIDDSAFKNYAIIGGEGEGASRTYAVYDGSGGGYKQKLFVDARDLRSENLTPAQYTAALMQRGREKLFEHQVITDFDTKIDPYKKGRVYLEDWDLGDRCDVVINIDSTTQFIYSARVTEIAEVQKENNLEVTITLGNKMPSVLQKAKR